MTERKTWRQLSRGQRAGLGVLGLIQMTLLAAALWDLRRRPDSAINGSKRLWKAAVFINYIGPIAYFWKGRRTSSG
jgi:hypothetical protein